MEATQVQQLKLNVTNINSFLKKSNKTYIGLKKQNATLLSNQIQRRKQESKEKKIETRRTTGFGLGKVRDKIASTAGSIFDKILGFGSFILAGVLVNSLPQIIETVRGVIDSIVEFVTPIQSAFNLIKGFMEGDFDKSKYDADKKRVDDKLVELNKDGGLIDQIAKQTGILEPLIKALKPAIDQVRNVVGGKNKVLAVKGGKEGVKDLDTGEFTERQFTTSERERYEQQRRGAGGAFSGSVADSPDLKTAIRRAESGNNYGATFRAYLDGFSRRNEDITNMSINQVVQYQKDYIAHQRRLGIPEGQRSAAVGAYQMLYPEVAANKTGVPLTAKFNKENQDRMADYYLNIAGYQQFINGRITAEQFNNRLAGQFASLKTTSGSGVYDTDGINRAYEDLLDLIKKSKPNPAKIKPITRDKNNQASVLNTTMGEEGSTTFVLMKQQVIT